MIRKGQEVRLIDDKSNDLPKRYIGRIGLACKRGQSEDDIQTWWVLFPRRKVPLLCWRDELKELG